MKEKKLDASTVSEQQETHLRGTNDGIVVNMTVNRLLPQEIIHVYMWQSHVEIEDYSVTYSQPFVSFLHCNYNMHNANSMSGVNEHSLHVGHPGVLNDTVKP